MIVDALIVAGGRGVRAGLGVPKQYHSLAGRPVLRHAVEAFARHPGVRRVVVVIHPDDLAPYETAVAGLGLGRPVFGGATRQASVYAGLGDLDAQPVPPTHVLIHDAARPLVTPGMIDRVVAALRDRPGVAPALPVVDSLRTGDAVVDGEVARDRLHRVQTPQGFNFAAIHAAHRKVATGGCGSVAAATDDIAVARMNGIEVALVAGDEAAFKLTMPHDFVRAEAVLAARMVPRSGLGFDVHRFGPGDHLWLCGVRVPHTHGLVGHSDADVGLHALTDALLGTIGAGDIGMHFPPSDPQWAGASSDRFLAHACALVRATGGVIDHLDLTIVAEAPKVGPHRAAFAARVAEITGCASVSIKATTTERLGFTGRGEGIAAQAVANVRVP